MPAPTNGFTFAAPSLGHFSRLQRAGGPAFEFDFPRSCILGCPALRPPLAKGGLLLTLPFLAALQSLSMPTGLERRYGQRNLSYVT